MKAKRSSAISAVGVKRATIRTTLLDVLKELTHLTKDDAVVTGGFQAHLRFTSGTPCAYTGPGKARRGQGLNAPSAAHRLQSN